VTIATDTWHCIGALDDLFGERACKGVEIEGVKVGLFRIEGMVFAIDDICTHGQALLSEGEFDGHEIECPLHAGLFDVRSGKALTAPLSRDARAHETRIEDGALFVRLAE
jgi:naphthalene 1,2-dioxygenase ferredoxin component